MPFVTEHQPAELRNLAQTAGRGLRVEREQNLNIQARQQNLAEATAVIQAQQNQQRIDLQRQQLDFARQSQIEQIQQQSQLRRAQEEQAIFERQMGLLQESRRQRELELNELDQALRQEQIRNSNDLANQEIEIKRQDLQFDRQRQQDQLDERRLTRQINLKNIQEAKAAERRAGLERTAVNNAFLDQVQATGQLSASDLAPLRSIAANISTNDVQKAVERKITSTGRASDARNQEIQSFVDATIKNQIRQLENQAAIEQDLNGRPDLQTVTDISVLKSQSGIRRPIGVEPTRPDNYDPSRTLSRAIMSAADISLRAQIAQPINDIVDRRDVDAFILEIGNSSLPRTMVNRIVDDLNAGQDRSDTRLAPGSDDPIDDPLQSPAAVKAIQMIIDERFDAIPTFERLRAAEFMAQKAGWLAN